MKQRICRVGSTVAVVLAMLAIANGQETGERLILSSGPVVRFHSFAGAPLKVTRVEERLAADGTLDGLELVVRNIGDRSVTAAKIYLHMPDDTGRQPSRFVFRYFYGRPNAWVTDRAEAGDDVLMPGDETTLTLLPAEDRLGQYLRDRPSLPRDFQMSVTVQRATFGDGTGWLAFGSGPGK
jgi:hypothetical protein